MDVRLASSIAVLREEKHAYRHRLPTFHGDTTNKFSTLQRTIPRGSVLIFNSPKQSEEEVFLLLC